MRTFVLWCTVGVAGLLGAAGFAVNGDFEVGTNLGWTEWGAPWGGGYAYDHASTTTPFAGTYSLKMSASSGSFGVYQEFCVEPGKTFFVEWAWRGKTNGPNGWWELLFIDAPFTYERADDPGTHPETTMLVKWETGFGGPYPAPSADWVRDDGEIVPTSDVVTIVLKCGASPGPVQVEFDNVTVTVASPVTSLTGALPAKGTVAGGDAIAITGVNLPPDAVVKLGANDVVGQERVSTCQIVGTTPAGAAGTVDIVLTSGAGTVTLPNGFTYVAPPQITAVEPNLGPIEGGTAVTITGSSLEGDPLGAATTVTFGGVALEQLQVVNATTVTGRTPAHAAGAVDVVVTTSYGTATLAGGFTYTSGTPAFVRGDCNADATTNIADAVSLLSYLFGGAAKPSCLEACNGNDDADVNIADAIAVLTYLFGGGGDLPPPFGACGPDPTPSPKSTCEVAHPNC